MQPKRCPTTNAPWPHRQDDEALSRKLWLAIARHMVEQSAGEGGAPQVRCAGCRRRQAGQESRNTAVGLHVHAACKMAQNFDLACALPPASPSQPERIRAVTSLLEQARGAVRARTALGPRPPTADVAAPARAWAAPSPRPLPSTAVPFWT